MSKKRRLTTIEDEEPEEMDHSESFASFSSDLTSENQPSEEDVEWEGTSIINILLFFADNLLFILAIMINLF